MPLAARNGSVVSAALFGSLAGADVLPFPARGVRGGDQGRRQGREREPEGLRRGLRPGARPSRTCGAAGAGEAPIRSPTSATRATTRCWRGCARTSPARRSLCWPPACARWWISRTSPMAAPISTGCAISSRPTAPPAARRTPTPSRRPAPKYLAVAMAYDDVIRVADLKTRASRYDRVVGEVGVKEERDPLHDRVHAPAHGGGDRHDAGGNGPLVRGPSRPPRAPRPVRLPRPARAHGHDPLVSRALCGRGLQAHASEDAAPRPRGGACRRLAGEGTGGAAGELPARRRGRRLPAAGEGLLGHPRPGRGQVRQGAVRRAPPRRSRRRRRLAAPPQSRRR